MYTLALFIPGLSVTQPLFNLAKVVQEGLLLTDFDVNVHFKENVGIRFNLNIFILLLASQITTDQN